MAAARTDEQLLSAFLKGELAALGELAKRYERPLLGLALGLLGGRRELACDAVQETWVRVIRFGRQFTGRSRFKTWVYRIGINQCRTLRRARIAADGGEAMSRVPSGDAHAGGGVEAAEQNHRLRRAVEALDEDKRLIVLLCYHGGMTHTEAAQTLRIPLGTLKSRLHAALGELRERLSAEMKP